MPLTRDIDLEQNSTKYRRLTNNKQFVFVGGGPHLHVHVEGGLAVVLLPPARAPRGCVHAAVSRGFCLCTSNY